MTSIRLRTGLAFPQVRVVTLSETDAHADATRTSAVWPAVSRTWPIGPQFAMTITGMSRTHAAGGTARTVSP
ncbi:hypothetical protein [Streptomyces sp. H27-C3]|uniref:hypothetical protein n=1 Tax=Streptomyces sp. H27-C3 TaxID=3046305 RepID=UPI0024BB917B|nr:hypothetical protein [Streptomyces sp. H27-C3]MDJ0466244.1 hypothetical protein [Streptomyces sp. H27-C3]